MRFLLFTILFCIALATTAQRDPSMVALQGEIRDAFNRPVSTKKEVGTEGSAYVYDEYKTGRIMVRGRTYSGINIKLNLEKNVVFFEKDGVEMVPSGEVSVVEFLDATTGKYSRQFRKGFPDVNDNGFHTFYEVLDSGKAMLLKRIDIKVRETTVYGDASIFRKYEQVKSYYVATNSALLPVKKNDGLMEAFNDKKTEVSAFISKNKIKANREDDLRSLISYYNQL